MMHTLEEGSDSVNFDALDVFGNKVSLEDQKDGYTLLAFFRYSSCPWCNLAIHRLTLEYKRLNELSCRIIAFVQSDTADVQSNIYSRHKPAPPFTIIADSAMKYYKLYNVDSSPKILAAITKIPHWLESIYKLGFKQGKIDGNLFLVPAWFLINNRTGKIIQSKHGIDFYDHKSFTSLYDSLYFKD